MEPRSLSANFYVNNMMDFAAAKKGAEPGVPCQVCEGLHGEAKSWCADCAVLLCESCTAIHRKISATRDHELVPQYVMKAEGVDKFQRKRHCDKHKKCELKLYCESCKALVCNACTVIDHRPGKDHNPVEIAAVAQRKKETLQELLQGIDSRLREIQVFMEEVDGEIAKLILSKEAATEQAQAYFRRLSDLLQKREQEILNQIDKQCRADDKALQTKKEEIKFELAGLTRTQKFCKEVAEHGSDVHILEVGNQVQTRVETLLAKQVDMNSYWSEFQFIENTTVADFAEEFKNLGGLSSDVDVSKCKVLVKPAVEGFRCVTVLTTMNKQSHPCVTHSKVVTSNMKDPSGTNLPTQVQMKRGGMQEISYVPKVTGSHNLEVKVNSQQVGGSPFDITVQSRDTPVLTMGQKGSGVGELYSPVSVAVDKDGNIAVVEQRNKRVQIFDADTGRSLGSFPVEGEYPCGIDVDSDGRFLVTSWGEDCGVRRYSKAGKLLNTPKSDCIKHPLGITVLKGGRMAVADLSQKSCLLLTHDGSLIREIGKGHLRTPYFIAVDELRDIILVSDYSANKVLAFDFEGVFKFNLGGQGHCLEHPLGLALDRAGNIIVVNNGDGRVQVFGPDGTFIRAVVTMKGGGPFGLTLTPDGYIAGACYTGHCVEVYRYN